MLNFGILLPNFILAQNDSVRVEIQGKIDTIKNTKPAHSPAKAILYSAVLPGLGQAYNKKYWKIPLVYGGAVAFGIAMHFNNNLYLKYLGSYTAKLNGDKVNDPFPNISADNALLGKNYYKRNRDFTIILSILFYGLQLIDANVDAHLKSFDLNDDLRVSLEPSTNTFYNTPVSGVSLKLHFK